MIESYIKINYTSLKKTFKMTNCIKRKNPLNFKDDCQAVMQKKKIF